MAEKKTRQLGSIRILSKLGHGGMGAVYVGFDLEARCFVAVKTLFAELAEDSKARARFEQEARVYSRLSHPNIVALLSCSDPGEGTQYIALEYVKGTSLRALLQEYGPLPPGDVLEIMEDLAKALDHSHAAGIIHRDVKPQNIVINQDGVLKLLDFGIARMTNTTGVGTATGQVLGTYAYAPPEQNQGKDIDQTADLYSLGVLAWEMLVGRRFVTGTTPPEIVLQQMRGPPEPPSLHVPGLPGELDAIIQKLCQPYPEERYRSASEVSQALRNLRRNLGAAQDAEAFFGDDIHEKWVLAKNAFNNQQYSLATSIAKYVVGRQPDFAPAHFLLGKLYAERSLPFNAQDSFRRALELQPNNGDYLLDFALTLFRMGELGHAHRELMRLLTLDPENGIALGFEEIVREQISARKATELRSSPDTLEAPLWFDTSTRDPPPADPPLEKEPPPSSGLAPPGLLSRTIAQGSVPRPQEDGTASPGPALSPARARLLSSLLPGLAHWSLGHPRQARLRGGAFLSGGLLLVAISSWTPGDVVTELVRMAALAGGAWGLGWLWLQSRRDAADLALRASLRGRVQRDLGDSQLRVDLGSERGVAVGQVFEVLRPSPQEAGGQAGEARLGELRIDRVRDRTAEGLFLPGPEGSPRPRPGDAVRILRFPDSRQAP